ncbi:hypothetical protein KOR42_50570 [Thalassoglobus neptunius]|uniref:SUKH-3 immunity protein n=1 Tax=Thalassoglobus neptunius TaxID=1938619 RepID=A0A5C5VQ39_9PLAN|nr:SUKH-3 domain-containing protein [Thalassoglobus neptunius]TWT39911.1 hypothetical protein KOR42_50570 [Thalassoglobus neptunius]
MMSCSNWSFRKEVEELFLDAGWFPERHVSQDGLIALCEEDGCVLSEPAKAILESFGGLTIESHITNMSRPAVRYIKICPSGHPGGDAWVEYVKICIGSNFFCIGDCGEVFLIYDEFDRVFITFEFEDIWLVGIGFEDAMETLLIDKSRQKTWDTSAGDRIKDD